MALETKNEEIASLKQRIGELSIYEELVKVVRSPDLSSSGVQIVASYPMEYRYDYYSTSQSTSRTIITLYVPRDGSVASLDLFIASLDRYPIRLTLQRGDAWINQTWVKLGTVAEVYDLNQTGSTVVWQAPVVWGLNATESGVYNTPQLSGGWYTLSMFGPVRAYADLDQPHPLLASSPYVYYELELERAKITSYRVVATVTVLNGGAEGFFAASCDWFK